MSIVTSLLIVNDSDPLAPASGTVVALVLIVGGLTAAVGILLARSRWARSLLLSLGLAHIGLIWWSGEPSLWRAVAVAGFIVEAAGAGPGARGWLRRRAGADGPPPIAVALLIGLLAFPAVVALSNPARLPGLAIVGIAAAVVAAIVYSRSGVVALWALRTLVPLGALLATAATPRWWSALVAAMGVVLTVLTWAPTVRQAAAPLLPIRSTGYRIPPELAPPEILDAAGLDEQGRRR